MMLTNIMRIRTMSKQIVRRFLRRNHSILALALTAGVSTAPVQANLDDGYDLMGLPLDRTVTASCGLVINEPLTTVVFDDDLYCASSPALTIAADDVTIDLNAKTLTVDDPQQGSWAILVRDAEHYTIRGNTGSFGSPYSTIDGTVDGIIGVTNSSHGTIYGINIKGSHSTSTGIGLYNSSYRNAIYWVDITAKSIAGLVIAEDSDNNRFYDSRMEYSNVGVSIESNSHDNSVSNTNFHATDYAVAAILVGVWPLEANEPKPVHNTRVVNNRIHNNISMWGIYFAPESTGEVGVNYVTGDVDRWHIEAENVSVYLAMQSFANHCLPDWLCRPF
ncbi:MAG: hypothetical protein AAGA91_05845 [Pseudomonadota bacterium]